MKSKILLMFTALLLLIAAPTKLKAEDDVDRITIESVEVTPNGTATVTVNYEFENEYYGFSVKGEWEGIYYLYFPYFFYDNLVKVNSPTPSEALSGLGYSIYNNPNYDEVDRYFIGFTCTSTNSDAMPISGSGKLFTFTITPSYSYCRSSDIFAQTISFSLFDSEGNIIKTIRATSEIFVVDEENIGQGKDFDYKLFPDEKFCQFISDSYDDNKDGYLSIEEYNNMTAVDSLDISNMELETIEGIYYFRSLKYLDCSHNKIGGVNHIYFGQPSFPPLLETLDCSYNQIMLVNTSEYFGPYPFGGNLKTANFSNNPMDDVSEFSGLDNLESLDVRNNTADLICLLHLSDLKNLTELKCDNSWKFLIVENCDKLEELSILDNNDSKSRRLGQIQLLNNKNLKNVSAKMTESLHGRNGCTDYEDLITIIGNPNLESVTIEGNCFPENYGGDPEEFDIEEYLEWYYHDELPSLTISDCDSLTNFDISNLVGPLILKCSNNGIPSIVVSNNPYLLELDCSHNNLSSLDVTKNIYLKELNCSYNNISSLDLTKNKKLVKFDCSHNRDITLNMAHGSHIAGLKRSNNGLSELDLSENTLLQTINCSYNNITELELPSTETLTTLDCSENSITSLDLSQNAGLISLDCNNNQLTALDLSNNTSLNISDLTIQQKFTDQRLGTNEGKLSFEVMLPSEESEVNKENFSDFTIKIGDNESKYDVKGVQGDKIILSDELTEDLDWRGENNTLSYTYSVPGSELKMEVSGPINSYFMYVNPASKEDDKDFYSGTLYVSNNNLLVPEGVEAFVANSTKDQSLVMEPIGNVIPAGTAVYLRTKEVSGLHSYGLHAFNVTNEGEDETIGDNLLQGTDNEITVESKSVLTLGRSEGEIGFWVYTGTTLNPHRAYIPLSSLQDGNVNGFRLDFDGTNDIVQPVSNTTAETQSWYNLQGVKMNGQPTQKGLYINNGKKILIK